MFGVTHSERVGKKGTETDNNLMKINFGKEFSLYLLP